MTQKLAFLKDVFNVPREIASKIEEINALRNALVSWFSLKWRSDVLR